jgi:UDP-2,3-diacylglucosamine hydrolase
MGQTYFISDVHLGTLSAEKERKQVDYFLSFLRSLETGAERIFFIGDLFDFWFEYKYVIPKKYFPVLYQLARLREKKIEMHYLPGNHDFWLGEFFSRELGIYCYPNDWSGELAGKKFYLFHGDGLAKKDAGYRLLKKVLRKNISLKLFRLLHPDLGIPLARIVSGSSRHYTDQLKLNSEPDYIEYADAKFQQGYDYVIMGHQHRPKTYETGRHKYINLGDWLIHYSYALFDGSQLLLKYYNQADK